jgi:2-methylisocitrate lyase-like PEP mutase family enzyme
MSIASWERSSVTGGLSLRKMIAGPKLTLVPLVFNAMSALMAQRAGFAAGYVGGATLGYLRATTEAALTQHDFAEVGLEIRTVSSIPLIMDAGCGWGDPVHMRRLVGLAAAAGYDAIEIEDQVVPKRAHHHVGIEHLIPLDEMAAKIAEAVRANPNPDFLIIARTNAARIDMNDALRRCEAYAAAGANMIFPIASSPEDLRILGERSPLPLMQMVHPGASFAHMGLSHRELEALNYRLLVDGITPFTDLYRTLSDCYQNLNQRAANGDSMMSAMLAANELLDLADMLEIERRTTERISGPP